VHLQRARYHRVKGTRPQLVLEALDPRQSLHQSVPDQIDLAIEEMEALYLETQEVELGNWVGSQPY